ncbi:MAG: hypothetical protein RBR99_04070 [Dehalococcoidales bacterium]|nr:hypothetical protein [Dehalococcoidales bacterium]MDX9986618.1 hypothetical protein [Dehalococcoidales bacterium]
MRDFNEKDKTKKRGRIQLSENPANLPAEKLAELESVISASLKDGYMPCPLAWKIARDAGVPRIAVGAIVDKMGRRVIDCQIGCFKVDKTPFEDIEMKRMDGEVVAEINQLESAGRLTCEAVFELARKYKLKPMDISNEINARDFKVSVCQLGCF